MTDEQRKALTFVLGYIDKSESCAPYKWQLHELLQAARATPAEQRPKYDPATQWGSPEFDGAEAYQAHLEAMYPNEVTPLDHHSDDRAVDDFALLMKRKMAASRAKGRGGWDDPNVCSVESLSAMLHEHVAKGDPVDVANFCMMLRHYGAKIVPADHNASESDTKRLDYLDERNARKNAANRTTYGWQLSENHNRIALEDHGFPARTVRQAIDLAIKSERERTTIAASAPKVDP